MENVRHMHEFLESDTEDHDEHEEDDQRDWQEKFMQLKKQEQLGDCTL